MHPEKVTPIEARRALALAYDRWMAHAAGCPSCTAEEASHYCLVGMDLWEKVEAKALLSAANTEVLTLDPQTGRWVQASRDLRGTQEP